jgi:hypothetical protein
MSAGADYFLDKMLEFEDLKALIAGSPPLPPRSS